MAKALSASAVTSIPVTDVANGKAVAAPVTGTIAELADLVSAQFAERRSIVDAVARVFVAGEHVFILGEPGTGKSLLIRTFAQALGLKYWETLLTRFSPPEEVFGPLSLKALEQDRYVRACDGYLPGCQVGFVDEIWKANSGILNALLTALNERVFHNDGKASKIPLVSCVSASNELPESESELAALYDRFLVRLVTSYIADRDAFKAMAFGAGPQVPNFKVDLLAEQRAARAVIIPDDVQDAVATLRLRVAGAGFKVSDRRWRQCVSLIKAAAHLAGRTEASVDDLECLEDVLWSKPDDRIAVAKLIQEVASPETAKAVSILDAAREAKTKLPPEPEKGAPEKQNTEFLTACARTNKDLKEMVDKLRAMPQTTKVAKVLTEVLSIRKVVSAMAARANGLDVD